MNWLNLSFDKLIHVHNTFWLLSPITLCYFPPPWYLPSLQVRFSCLLLFCGALILLRALCTVTHLEICTGSWLVHCWSDNWKQWLNLPHHPSVSNSSPEMVRAPGALPGSGVWLVVDRPSLVQETAAAVRLCLQWLCHALKIALPHPSACLLVLTFFPLPSSTLFSEP